MLTQQTLLFADGGSKPTSPHLLHIKEGSFHDFSSLLKKYHYKSDRIGGSIAHHLVLTFGGRVYGGVSIGPMRHDDKYEEGAVELRRMVLDPDCPVNTASYFLGKCIWWLRKHTNVTTVYTFADTTVGHTGVCYRAANFSFVRETEPSVHVLWKGQRYHPRSLSIDRPYSYELRQAVEAGEAIIERGKPKLLYKYDIRRRAMVRQ